MLYLFSCCVQPLLSSAVAIAPALCVCVCASPRQGCWSLLIVGLCLCSSSPLSCCLCVFLTDCAISVCLYLSLTWTTKQRYAHLFFPWVCLLLSSLPFIALEGGRGCSGCSRGCSGLCLSRSPPGCACVRVCRCWQRGRGLWYGAAFLHCSRLLCTLRPSVSPLSGARENAVARSGRPGQGCWFCSARKKAFSSRFLGCCGGVSSGGRRG